ncbi:MAG: acetate--CoA ligase [Planctomycetota bacterium]
MLREDRVFDPPRAEDVGAPFWHVSGMDQYREMHRRSVEDPGSFFGEAARELRWFEDFGTVVEFEPPDARWFVGGTTNLCYNCVDRHCLEGHGEQVGLVWEGEPAGEGGPEVRTMTYDELRVETARFASALRSLGVGRGDVVTIYMGMVPELAVAVLACARIGAVHSVIFGGFSAHAIADRVADAQSRVVVTCDGAWRRGRIVPLKANVDEAISGDTTAERVVVLRRCDNEIGMEPGRDLEWSELMAGADDGTPCVALESEADAFLLYTSGSTGKPKGIRHTVAGYMVHAYLTSKYVFNMIPGLGEPRRPDPLPDGQLYWCTADVGWITGHTYIVYGPMMNRVPTLMYEGAPNAPAEDRFWDIVERHRVTQFYTAPTAIRAFMKWGDEHVEKHDLSSLQVLGSVGEPINPEAWMWYREKIGRGVCPIVDTWWQTETGGHMLTPLPGATPTKPGSCCLPFFGVDAAIVDEAGDELPNGSGGLLAIRKPWPSMLRGVYGDRERFLDTYWRKFDVDGALAHAEPEKNVSPYYFAGDSARRSDDGYFWIMGRVDDVINVSGHRLGTMEVESALVAHPAVVEAAVVGMPHEIKGTGIAAFCTLEPSRQPSDEGASDALRAELRSHVAREIGAIAKPDQIRFTDALPKTRSGKIMRRLLRDVAAGTVNTNQDTSTLEDFNVLAKLQETDG